jgi:FkbM family methyltransferase
MGNIINAKLFPIKRFIHGDITKIGGYDIKLDLDESIQRTIFMGFFERDETIWVKHLVKPGNTFVDIGSNIGYYSFLASGIVGDTGKVFSIEPHWGSMQSFKGNIERCGIKNITPIQIGIGDCERKERLYECIDKLDGLKINSCSCSRGLPTRGNQMREIAITTLDKLAEYNHIDSIDFLKMDIEGMEVDAIKGMDRLLSEHRVNRMLIEINDYVPLYDNKFGETLDELIKSYGFYNEREKVYDLKLKNVLYKLR